MRIVSIEQGKVNLAVARMLQFGLENARNDELDSTQYRTFIEHASPEDLQYAVARLLSAALGIAGVLEDMAKVRVDVDILTSARDLRGNLLDPQMELRTTTDDGREGRYLI